MISERSPGVSAPISYRPVVSIDRFVAVCLQTSIPEPVPSVFSLIQLLSLERMPRSLSHRRVAVDEIQIEVDGEKKWLYAAIDTDS